MKNNILINYLFHIFVDHIVLGVNPLVYSIFLLLIGSLVSGHMV